MVNGDEIKDFRSKSAGFWFAGVVVMFSFSLFFFWFPPISILFALTMVVFLLLGILKLIAKPTRKTLDTYEHGMNKFNEKVNHYNLDTVIRKYEKSGKFGKWYYGMVRKMIEKQMK